ncbi:MAG: MIP/aquaporin family protein [Phycisphaerales bacterium JB037]
MNDLTRGCVAEFIGTFALVFFGAGSVVLAADLSTPAASPYGGLLIVAAAHALVLTVFVTGLMYVSGAQFNPAVSLALLAIGKQSPRQAGAFIGVQLVAAACGAGAVVFVYGPEIARAAKVGATLPADAYAAASNIPRIFVTEVLLTFTLMFIILTAVVDARAHRLGGFCVGLVVATCIFGFGPVSGASMNPARSFGPALYGYWDLHWLYWFAPITGAVLAAVAYKVVWEHVEDVEPQVPPLHEGDATEKH